MKPTRPVLPLWAFSVAGMLFAGIAMMFLFTPTPHAGPNPALPAAIALIFLSLLSTLSGIHIRSLTQRIDQLEKTLAERDKEA